MFQSLVNYIDEGVISAMISAYHTGEQSMTTWAIQSSHYGNEVKIWADVFHNDHFADAKRHAERQAELLGEPVTIWKVGSISEFKWMEVK